MQVMVSSHSGSDKKRHWILPASMRDELKEVVGQIVKDEEVVQELENSKMIVTVGDVVTLTLLELGIIPDISIVDYQTKRIPMEEVKSRLTEHEQQIVIVKNPAGEITEELWNVIEDGYKNPRKLRIVVIGEEDLASLVCVALAPVDTTVIYGIPFKGLMVLHVDRHLSAKAEDILKRMEK